MFRRASRSQRLLLAVLISTLLVALGCASLIGLDRFQNCADGCDADQPAPDAGREERVAPGADAAEEAAPDAPAEQPIYRVNCGCTAGCGIIGGFSPDNYYNGTGDRFGIDATIDMSLVHDAAPMAIYQTYRYVNGLGSTFTYLFPDLTPSGHYGVRLHFADIFNDAAGQRAFNVVINDETVLTAFDIIAQAGAPLRALDKDFATAADDGGVIRIDFVASDLDSACVNGIEVWSE
jgi:hypothetical protein